MANVLDVQIVWSEKNHFGNVRSGHMKMHTRVAAGIVMPDKFKFGLGASAFDDRIFDAVCPDSQALVILETSGRLVWQGGAVLDDEGHRCRQVVVALIIPARAQDRGMTKTKWWLLLLEDAREMERTYRRVGLGVVGERYNFWSEMYEKPNFDRDWTEQVITII